jgi:alpha-N-arabinofuranosidase
VGSDYYLVNSSFQYFPGVPVYHSKDLVNWKLIGNVLDRDSQLPLKGATSWQGIYAPTLRYYDGKYYMITTNVGSGGNFMVTASRPEGPWSEPIWLQQQGIDPSLYFEDGRCYMVSNPDNTITLCEIDPKTGRQLTESRPLWGGTGGRYPEGPHIYKKDGYYYLLISEGGTELAHRLTIARSRSIYGPYEANPQNPLLTHCCVAAQTSQIQGTGHGDMVEGEDGSWWVVFLAYRNLGDGSYHHLGRETFLAPVEWKEGQWPVVNGGKPIDTLMNVCGIVSPPSGKKMHYDFSEPFGHEWLYIQNPIAANYDCKKGCLTLKSNGTLLDNKQPTFIGFRQESAEIVVETEVDANSLASGTKAGLALYQINDGYYDLSVEKGADGKCNVTMNFRAKSLNGTSAKAAVSGNVKLRITSDGTIYRFEYATGNDKQFKNLTSHNCAMVSTEVVGGFTGIIIGMFAEGNGNAQFHYLDYQEK